MAGSPHLHLVVSCDQVVASPRIPSLRGAACCAYTLCSPVYAVQRAVPSLCDAAACLLPPSVGQGTPPSSPWGRCRSHPLCCAIPSMLCALLLLHRSAYPSALCAPGERGAACSACCVCCVHVVLLRCLHQPDVAVRDVGVVEISGCLISGPPDSGPQVLGPPKDSMDPTVGIRGLGSGRRGPEGLRRAGRP